MHTNVYVTSSSNVYIIPSRNVYVTPHTTNAYVTRLKNAYVAPFHGALYSFPPSISSYFFTIPFCFMIFSSDHLPLPILLSSCNLSPLFLIYKLSFILSHTIFSKLLYCFYTVSFLFQFLSQLIFFFTHFKFFFFLFFLHFSCVWDRAISTDHF